MKKYTAEEKAQLLANLDLEVSHRARQFEEFLADALETFRVHQEGLVARVPRLVRGLTLREFARHGGDVQAALQAAQRARLGGAAEAIDRTTRKRKWIESQEEPGEGKAAKAARTTASPKKKVGFPNAAGAGQNARIPKTPSTSKTTQRVPPTAPSPSPHKQPTKPVPFAFGRTTPRPASPTKIPFNSPSKPSRPATRPPSTTHFNPTIPAASSSSFPRWPKKDEAMVSVNGSPLANPLKFGFDLSGWLTKVVDTGKDDDAPKGHHPNSIIVRTASQDRPASQASHGTHSRANSAASTRQNHNFVPARGRQGASSSQSPAPDGPLLPAAVVAVPTLDGHVLQFDPFLTSPDQIDAIPDISDDAKQQAKGDMRRLVAQAMERWKI
ncbi:Nbl1/borealin N terminal domain-containing protein [Phanerochaete sordida]|uniref:Nbl1/borealin N terminal domain-containing protein n=1 Tax=Phanerochaete sordida TaxID=48140 RepID=A0A9P3LBW9_9APHY|nr:Nbl1/borealin N terminal domain-containing protein [Phanerochaete sordida]